MLLRYDPFRELDRMTSELFKTTRSRDLMAMDAYRDGDRVVVEFDLPGVDPSSVDVTVERDVLRVSASRPRPEVDDADLLVSERPYGTFRRELFLGESLDGERVEANLDRGVLRVTVPIAESVQPRRVEISTGSKPEAIETSSREPAAAQAS